MEVCRAQALLIGEDHAVRRRIRASLGTLDLDVTEALDGRSAFAIGPDRPVRGVVVADPLADPPLPGFLRAARKPGSPLRSCGLVVVAPRTARGRVEGLIGHGANRVVDLEDVEAALPATLDRLLRVAPRVQFAAPARVAIVGTRNTRRVFCRTVNLSTSGALLRMPYRLPVGAALSLELFLANGQVPLCGEATVVRRTVPTREPDPGVGVAFTRLDPAQTARLAAHVERLLA